MKIGIVAVAALSLGGCMQEWRPEPPIEGNCSVSEAARMRFTGMRLHDEHREDIQRATNSRIARVLRPDDAATMDFRPDRLNILVDDLGQIAGLRCG